MPDYVNLSLFRPDKCGGTRALVGSVAVTSYCFRDVILLLYNRMSLMCQNEVRRHIVCKSVKGRRFD